MGFLFGMILGAVLWHFGKDIALDMWAKAGEVAKGESASEVEDGGWDEALVAGGVFVRFVEPKSGLVYLRDHLTTPFSVGVGEASRFNTIDDATKALKRHFPDYTGYYNVIDQHGHIWFQHGGGNDPLSDKISDAMLKGYGL